MNDTIPRHVDDAISQAVSMLPAQMDTVQSRVMLYAIGLQESGFAHRFQVVQGEPDAKGPARGYWQFERGGGVRGVMEHNATEKYAEHACVVRGVSFKTDTVWKSLETDDVLAACFARLLLWADAKSLPKVSDQDGGWDCYVRNWRPGKPHPDKWFTNHSLAVLHVSRQR